MQVYSVGSGETVYEQGGCVGTRFYEAAGCEFVHLSIPPGGEIPEHALPIPVSFYVLSGTGTVSVDGESTNMASGEMVECPPDVSRGWKNGSSSVLEVLVIKRV